MRGRNFVPEKPYRKYLRVSVLSSGIIMLTLDATMVLFALPSIGKGLGISMADVGWVMILYNLFGYCFLVAFGRIGDIVGRRNVFLLGCASFVCFSALNSLALDFWMLLVTRTLQGTSAGMIGASYPALVTVSFPKEETGRAFGSVKTIVAIVAVLGPIISGGITQAIGWRLVFLINIPLGLISVFLCLRLIPESRGTSGEPLDTRGTVLLIVALIPLALFLTQGNARGWTDPAIISFIVIAVAGGWFLGRHLLRFTHPIIDLKLFKIPSFALSNSAALARGICHEIFYYVTPFFLECFLGIHPYRAGIMISIGSGASLLFLYLSGVLSDRIGCTPLEVIGMCITAVSFLLVAVVFSSITITVLVISLILLGIGFGIFNSPNQSSVMSSVPEEHLGLAGGIYGTMRVMGFMIGIPLVSAIMGHWADKRYLLGTSGAALGNPSFEGTVHHVYLLGLTIALLGVGVCLLKYRYRGDTWKKDIKAENRDDPD